MHQRSPDPYHRLHKLRHFLQLSHDKIHLYFLLFELENQLQKDWKKDKIILNIRYYLIYT